MTRKRARQEETSPNAAVVGITEKTSVEKTTTATNSTAQRVTTKNKPVIIQRSAGVDTGRRNEDVDGKHDGSADTREKEGGEGDSEEVSSSEEDGSGDDGEDDDGDEDSDGDMNDYRKRIRRNRDKDRAAQAASSADAHGSTEVARDGQNEGIQGEEGQDSFALEFPSDGTYRNKQRVLLFSSRGITSRFRHLLGDLRKLIPHHKKDVKLDVGRGESLSSAVNEIAEIKSCNSCVFLECRKRTDLYLWAGKAPNGPSAKFHVLNVHTMDELKLTGNCMLGSRPLLSFDSKFDQTPHWKVVKGILMDIFNTPRGHPKSKPFIDRVMSFFVADGKVWVRNYQVVDKGDGSSSALNRKIEQQTGADVDPLSLVEMGPRFVLNPIRVFAGSFGGPTLYHNAAYVSPNDARALKKRKAGFKFEDRKDSKKVVREKKAEPAVPRGPLDDVFLG